MSKLNGREVSVARFHAATHVTGYGNIPTNVDSNVKKFGLRMFKEPDGLYITWNNGKGEAFLSGGNIISLEFVAEKQAPLEKSEAV